MSKLIKLVLHIGFLTLKQIRLVFFTIQLNIPTVPKRGVLPVARKRGILTLTLVISRELPRPTVRRGFYVMWTIFRVKTKLETQIEEYVGWKAKFSEYKAKEHKDYLLTLRMSLPNRKEIREILLNDLQDFHDQISKLNTPYTSMSHMKAVRGFFSYYWSKKQHAINPKLITDEGILELKPVVENDIVPLMIKRKPGRPKDIVFIKKVKTLRDQGHLSFRAIARAENTNPGNVHRAYHYDIKE